MAYIDVDSDNFLEDILQRKEFHVLKNKRVFNPPTNVLPNFAVEKEIKKGHYLQFYSHQLFVQNFANPNTPYNRLLMKHSTGSGKTLGALGIAMQFIKYFHKEMYLNPKSQIGSIFIIAFEGAREAFKKELLRHPEFGFVTSEELLNWEKLRQQAQTGAQVSVNRLNDYGNRIKRRMSNRKGNGFFKFFGYRALMNKLFKSEQSLINLSNDELHKKIKNGDIDINHDFLEICKNSLFICDEIHVSYNSLQQNNWGITLQLIFDSHPSVRAVLLSATPINNSIKEIVDLLNYLLPKDKRIMKEEFFDKNGLKPRALGKLKELSTGRISYLIDKNPMYYPSRSFTGESIKGIPYLKFIRCPFTVPHLKAYNSVFNKTLSTIQQDSIYVTDFILPNPNGTESLFKTEDIKTIKHSDQKWKINNNIDVKDGIVTGTFLQISNLKSVSNKYYKMLKNILQLIKNRSGKVMIYHNYVNMSGVLFIKEIFLRNGFIDEYMNSAPNTICSICGEKKSDHKELDMSSVKSTKKKHHDYKPVRFIVLIGDLDTATRDKSIYKFNHPSNTMGDNIMILIGSRMIKESYTFKAIQHMMVMSRPDNIPTLIQIMGRAVRNNSHSLLPEKMKHVNISLYTSSLPNGGLSYDEIKYKEKIKEYKIIQSIEKVFHENAIDSIINYDTIKMGLEHNTLGDLFFTPTIAKKKTVYKLSELNLNTFNVYHAQKEIDMITYIIKRAFIETSPVWTYPDLLSYIKKPDFSIEYDTTLISDENVIISLSKLIWDKDNIANPYIKNENKKINVIDKLFDVFDKRIVMPNGSMYIINQVEDYYMICPLVNGRPELKVDSIYRIQDVKHFLKAPVIDYLENHSIQFNYEAKLHSFYNKYKDTTIDKLADVLCDHGVDFHVKFIEDTIKYIFNSWTDWNTDKSKYHEFYFKMLHYYSIIGLIIFADTSKQFIFDLYKDYLLDDIDLSKKNEIIDRNTRNTVNLLSREISNTTCEWCPKFTKELYHKSLSKSLKRFSLIKKTKEQITKVHPDSLPIGHIIETIPKFYLPDRGWFSSPEYLIDKKKWVENPIIIGYNTKSKSGLHIRFKLRKPIQKIKIHKDARLIEKGSICMTRLKPDLLQICKKLKIKIEPKSSTVKICREIKSRLMQLELIERSKGTNVKFFYSYFEIPS
jgi:S-ribosylhomocysteine lyase LuxS involved in autoinducer biosynthesis